MRGVTGNGRLVRADKSSCCPRYQAICTRYRHAFSIVGGLNPAVHSGFRCVNAPMVSLSLLSPIYTAAILYNVDIVVHIPLATSVTPNQRIVVTLKRIACDYSRYCCLG